MATQVGSVIFAISADLRNIQGSLRTLEGNFNTSFGRIEGLAKNFGRGILQGLIAGVSVGALTGFTKEVLALADSLQNLSDQTGLSVELLSGIKSPLEEAGTSMDAFAKGVFNLQKNLGNVDSDNDKVAQSIKRLGLSLDDLRNSSPDEFIRKVTDALAKIENPVERNTILFNLLGKSAKELGPAFQQLVGRFEELRAKGLTAADVKALDDVGDALTRLKNQALVLGAEGVAGILRFFGALRDVPKVGANLSAATANAARVFNLPQARVEGMTSKEIIAQAEQAPEPLRRSARIARDELLNLREEFNKLNAVNIKAPAAVFKGISDGAKKSKKDVDNLVDSFLDGLAKQLENINTKKIELQFGADAGLGAQLDAQLERFKDNLRDKQLPIPKGLDEFFKSFKDRILAANDELRRMQHELAKLDELGKAFSQDSAEFLNVPADLAKRDEERKRPLAELEDLRQQLKLGAMDTSTPEAQNRQRIASIEVEFVHTANRITELGQAAGATQEQIAADIALAWQKALQDISRHVDESAAQWADAFEGTSLAIVAALNEIGTGKSIKDIFLNMGRRISDALTQALVTKPIEKWIKDQADQIATGQGGLADIFKNIFGGGQQAQTQTQSGVMGKLGEQNLGGEAAIAAIETTSATAQTGLQTSAAAAQTGITTTGTTAQAGINAVLQAALAAIAAAKAASGLPGIPLTPGGSPLDAITELFSSSPLDMGPQSAGGGLLALGFHTGGAIGDGGTKRVVLALPSYHAGGGLKPDERLIVGQTGEHMMNRIAVNNIGKQAFDFMNATGRMPESGGGGDQHIKAELHVHGVTDADSFRRSKSTILAESSPRRSQRTETYLVMAFTIVPDTLPIFPTDISFERPGFTRYLTDVTIVESGHEQRNRYWLVPRKRWDVGYGVREIIKIEALIDFFDCCFGRHFPFRYRDWIEYKSCSIVIEPDFDDQSLGVATAGQTEFQLKKTKTRGPYQMVADIIKPDGPTILIGEDDSEVTDGWTINELTGIITRGTPLAGGEVITWGGEFYYKARFDADEIERNFIAWEAGAIEVPVIELRAQ